MLSPVGHSTGGGEVAIYIGRHGTTRVAKIVMVGAVPPLNRRRPAGQAARSAPRHPRGTAKNRSRFYYDLTILFYGFNREGAAINEGLRENFRRIGLQGSVNGQFDCVHGFSEVDYTDDLKAIDKPVLGEKAGDPAWTHVPSWFVYGGGDKNIPAKSLAFMAERAGSKHTVVIDGASHVVTVSHSKTSRQTDGGSGEVTAFTRSQTPPVSEPCRRRLAFCRSYSADKM